MLWIKKGLAIFRYSWQLSPITSPQKLFLPLFPLQALLHVLAFAWRSPEFYLSFLAQFNMPAPLSSHAWWHLIQLCAPSEFCL